MLTSVHFCTLVLSRARQFSENILNTAFVKIRIADVNLSTLFMSLLGESMLLFCF